VTKYYSEKFENIENKLINQAGLFKTGFTKNIRESNCKLRRTKNKNPIKVR